MDNFLQRPEWIAEAQEAIRAVEPSASTVVHAIRGYAIPGIPDLPPLSARLEDGSQWLVENGQARKLSEEEIAEREARLASYHFGD